MIHTSKLSDERRECGAIESWLLHGAVGAASDWRGFAAVLAERKIGTRAVDLWRFLDGASLPIADFGAALNKDVRGASGRNGRVLIGYSMGGRLALHALLEKDALWQAAVLVSAHPGLESEAGRASRRERDAGWATHALTDSWAGFLSDWGAQPVLEGVGIRDAPSDSRLALRRREIARSFIDWSLGAQDPLWERLQEIDIPVLWVAGEKDDGYVEIANRACAILPNARMAIAPGCGHRVPWEAEGWLVEQVVGFLGRDHGA